MHPYERNFLVACLVILVTFLLFLAYAFVVVGAQTPHEAALMDPAAVFGDPAWNAPYVKEVDAQERVYEAHVVALRFAFLPQRLEVPSNSTVRFHLTSTDVIHGFYVPGTAVNAMVVPGFVTTFSLDFGAPEDVNVICHEYCGIGHHFMEQVIEVRDDPEGVASRGGGDG